MNDKTILKIVLSWMNESYWPSFYFIINTLTIAHSVRIDINGGHNDNNFGGYHYHNKGVTKITKVF